MKFCEEHRLKIVEFYYTNGQSLSRAARAMNNWARQNNAQMPRCSKKDVYRVMQRLKTQFTLRDGQKEKSGRPKTVRTEANIQLVLNEISDKPNVSLRMVAQNLSL